MGPDGGLPELRPLLRRAVREGTISRREGGIGEIADRPHENRERIEGIGRELPLLVEGLIRPEPMHGGFGLQALEQHELVDFLRMDLVVVVLGTLIEDLVAVDEIVALGRARGFSRRGVGEPVVGRRGREIVVGEVERPLDLPGRPEKLMADPFTLLVVAGGVEARIEEQFLG